MISTTLYWDDKDKRFVLIVNTPPRVKHHKLPRTCHDKGQALAFIKAERLPVPAG